MSGISKIGAAFTSYAVRPVGQVDTAMDVDGNTQKSGERHNPQNRENAMAHMSEQKVAFDYDAWARALHVKIQLSKQLG